jgi:hypothetical protein
MKDLSTQRCSACSCTWNWWSIVLYINWIGITHVAWFNFEHKEAFSKIHDNEMLGKSFSGRLGVSSIPVFAMILPKDAAFFHRQCYFANTRSCVPMLNTTHNELGTLIWSAPTFFTLWYLIVGAFSSNCHCICAMATKSSVLFCEWIASRIHWLRNVCKEHAHRVASSSLA